MRRANCGGVQIHVTDREAFTPVIVGIAMIKTAYDMYTEHFQWKQEAYEYVYDVNPFDVVCGTDKIRKQIESGVSLERSRRIGPTAWRQSARQESRICFIDEFYDGMNFMIFSAMP